MLPSASGPDEQKKYPFDLVYFLPHSMSLNDLFLLLLLLGVGVGVGGVGFGVYYGGSLVALP